MGRAPSRLSRFVEIAAIWRRSHKMCHPGRQEATFTQQLRTFTKHRACLPGPVYDLGRTIPAPEVPGH